MPVDIQDHPDAPDLEELQDFVVEPVHWDEIERRRHRGETLVEENLREREDLDAYIELDADPHAPGSDDVGTALYRLVQLFGTPQFPEYHAGSDISDRSDTTFKYLFRVHQPDGSEGTAGDPGREWLVTVFDWHVSIGVGLAEWRDDPSGTVDVETEDGFLVLALVASVVGEPVECEYEDVWY